MKKENDHVLNDWVFSNNPKILKKNKDVKELMSDLCEREEFYQRKMAECEERANRSIKIYQGKIRRIQKVMQRLTEEQQNDRHKQMGTAFRGRETRSSRFTVRLDAEKCLAVRKHADSKGSNTEVKRKDDKGSDGAGFK